MLYSHPLAEHVRKSGIMPGDTVEHRNLPGISLIVQTGPEKALDGNNKYMVLMPDGTVVPVKEKNLIR